jgi:hypothetical protein
MKFIAEPISQTPPCYTPVEFDTYNDAARDLFAAGFYPLPGSIWHKPNGTTFVKIVERP